MLQGAVARASVTVRLIAVVTFFGVEVHLAIAAIRTASRLLGHADPIDAEPRVRGILALWIVG
jgi:hypothetical protein